ncbi:NADP-dependent 3-hydroxy acid dehydrogenase YdfG [Ancylobacter aquaticus]|uniref:NADP-dependent 3-hydroxy acid dehydrogenase YdfG n=1 Tax=Ancylobacter aquaticus TaxID=100 RepID=A0A4V2PJF5_ANCAQ|nr:SDR family NAD(P)-dependent oxidoreductase [Ancylobacter aquaticus]TCK28306.1 NADP-dependent 3-hydroxy acid dehydrogenase YdfG [Ancylobacter aquaticus]
MKPTAIVTGATGGIGRVIVAQLTQAGYATLALGTNESALADLAARTGCRTRTLDICDAQAVMAALAGEKTDVVIHSAGVLGPQLALHETPDDVAHRLVAINILGTVNILRAVVPAMKAADAGTIVMLGSICGTVPGTGPALYSATKAAMHAMSANLRVDMRDSHIRVTEILLGRVQTGIHDQLGADEEFYDGYECLTPANVAATILHVLSSPAFVDLTTIEMLPTRQVVGGALFSKG